MCPNYRAINSKELWSRGTKEGNGNNDNSRSTETEGTKGWGETIKGEIWSDIIPINEEEQRTKAKGDDHNKEEEDKSEETD